MHSETNFEKDASVDVKGIVVDHVERDCSSDEEGISAADQLQASKILHKVDRRLLPVLALLYLIAFLDRGNLGNAKVRGCVYPSSGTTY